MVKSAVKGHQLTKWTSNKLEETPDVLAVEEPLEIRLSYWNGTEQIEQPLSVTMRTPGNDLELTVGFLFTEGIINSYDEIKSIRHCETVEKEDEKENVVKVVLNENHTFDLTSLQRNFYTTSSCGVCGKSSIDAISVQCSAITSNLKTSPKIISELNEKLRNAQTVFEYTGGLHASALFDAKGILKLLREDVGRHNALDKVIGAELFDGNLPLFESILLVSGRASFELVQKATRAGIGIMVAVGAPSSLAVELAQKQGITLIGFSKPRSFNIYTHPHRIKV